jgi:hypothetical protein
MASADAVSIVRELDIRESGQPGSLAFLGPGGHAAPYHSVCAKTGHHKANRLAYFSSHLFDAASIYGSRAENHARAAAPFDNSCDARHIHGGSHNGRAKTRRRQWLRSCSEKRRRRRKLCLEKLYFLYLFCAFSCPHENGALSVSSLERMAGTTRLELATSAMTAARLWVLQQLTRLRGLPKAA